MVQTQAVDAAVDEIESHGAELIASGAAATVISLVESLPAADRERYRVRLIYADALRTNGQPDSAATVFEQIRDGLDETLGLAPELAWRVGMLHYLRGDYARAEAECARAAPVEEQSAAAVDAVLAQACRASALAALGETACSSAIAAEAVARATALGDDRALAAAHTSAAYLAGGIRRDEHLAQALAAAERSNDVLAQARVLTNQVDGLLRETRYRPALELSDRAVQAAERTNLAGLLVTALCNAGESRLRLGLFDDSAHQYERAVRTSRRLGLNRTAMGLWGVAEVHRRCGRREQARAVFEETVDLAREGGDVQILVPALAGLSGLLLSGPGRDLRVARALIEEAQQRTPPRLAGPALIGVARLELAVGKLAAASAAAVAAVDAARAGRRLDHLAESLELAAAVSADPAVTRSHLLEAETIWRRAGATPAADRISLLRAGLPGADGAERAEGVAAAERLVRLGVQDPAGPAEGATAPLRVRVLGGFEVEVEGRPVPLAAWRSKQARTLIKILVARRGRPVRRSELCELLWPDDDPARTGHRLSVLLSVVRAVLDPQHLWSVDHYLRADLLGLSMDLTHVAVDAENLLSDAAFGRQLITDGQPESARTVLAEVDRQYRGPVFEEELSDGWATDLREEVRSVWLRTLRELADLSRAAGDWRQTATVLTRLLTADPYDEDAHHLLVRMMVRSRRHGEARRAFGRWVAAMREIGAPPPDPCVLGPGQAGASPSP